MILGLGLFMSYLCELYFFLILILIINHENRHLFYCTFFRTWPILDDNVHAESKYFSNSKSSVSGCCLALA